MVIPPGGRWAVCSFWKLTTCADKPHIFQIQILSHMKYRSSYQKNTETNHTSSPHSGMLNLKLREIFSLVCTFSNSNIASAIRHCNFESALVWKQSMLCWSKVVCLSNMFSFFPFVPPGLKAEGLKKGIIFNPHPYVKFSIQTRKPQKDRQQTNDHHNHSNNQQHQQQQRTTISENTVMPVWQDQVSCGIHCLSSDVASNQLYLCLYCLVSKIITIIAENTLMLIWQDQVSCDVASPLWQATRCICFSLYCLVSKIITTIAENTRNACLARSGELRHCLSSASCPMWQATSCISVLFS